MSQTLAGQSGIGFAHYGQSHARCDLLGVTLPYSTHHCGAGNVVRLEKARASLLKGGVCFQVLREAIGVTLYEPIVESLIRREVESLLE